MLTNSRRRATSDGACHTKTFCMFLKTKYCDECDVLKPIYCVPFSFYIERFFLESASTASPPQ